MSFKKTVSNFFTILVLCFTVGGCKKSKPAIKDGDPVGNKKYSYSDGMIDTPRFDWFESKEIGRLRRMRSEKKLSDNQLRYEVETRMNLEKQVEKPLKFKYKITEGIN